MGDRAGVREGLRGGGWTSPLLGSLALVGAMAVGVMAIGAVVVSQSRAPSTPIRVENRGSAPVVVRLVGSGCETPAQTVAPGESVWLYARRRRPEGCRMLATRAEGGLVADVRVTGPRGGVPDPIVLGPFRSRR